MLAGQCTTSSARKVYVCCVEPPTVQDTSGLISYAGVTRIFRLLSCILCGSTSHFLQKLVNDFLFPASRQVKEARDRSGGLNWLVLLSMNYLLTENIDVIRIFFGILGYIVTSFIPQRRQSTMRVLRCLSVTPRSRPSQRSS